MNKIEIETKISNSTITLINNNSMQWSARISCQHSVRPFWIFKSHSEIRCKRVSKTMLKALHILVSNRCIRDTIRMRTGHPLTQKDQVTSIRPWRPTVLLTSLWTSINPTPTSQTPTKFSSTKPSPDPREPSRTIANSTGNNTPVSRRGTLVLLRVSMRSNKLIHSSRIRPSRGIYPVVP